jgi:hypothetical protein
MGYRLYIPGDFKACDPPLKLLEYGMVAITTAVLSLTRQRHLAE